MTNEPGEGLPRSNSTTKRKGCLEEALPPADVIEEHPDAEWFVIHTYSGYENKVKANLEHRIASMDVADQIFQVVVPTEDEIEIKNGQRRTVQKKVFPGYVLVQMNLTDESWYVVRNTPGVDQLRRVRQQAGSAEQG